MAACMVLGGDGEHVVINLSFTRGRSVNELIWVLSKVLSAAPDGCCIVFQRTSLPIEPHRDELT